MVSLRENQIFVIGGNSIFVLLVFVSLNMTCNVNPIQRLQLSKRRNQLPGVEPYMFERTFIDMCMRQFTGSIVIQRM